ncbi:MAG: hypothetical protein IPI67_21215 [Myxococcales bacterium]|nr:hypothetical protein [Myxococcales bacterium]
MALRVPGLWAASCIALLSSSAGADELVVATAEVTASPQLDPDSPNTKLDCLRPGARCPRRGLEQQVVALFGLRGSETAVAGSDTKGGVSLSSTSASYLTDRQAGVSARASHFAFLGGGRGGMQGGIGVDLGIGLYQAVGPHHGPFSRLGGRGFVLSYPVFYASLIELPDLQLGYQWLSRSLHLELALRAGPVLTGRMHPDGERRRLGGGFEWGGHTALRAGAVSFELELTHVEGRDDQPRGGVDLVAASLCGGARFLGACFDARLFSGRTDSGASPRETVVFGLSVGSFTDESNRAH